jgi:hypothetical protein
MACDFGGRWDVILEERRRREGIAAGKTEGYRSTQSLKGLWKSGGGDSMSLDSGI